MYLFSGLDAVVPTTILLGICLLVLLVVVAVEEESVVPLSAHFYFTGSRL